MSAATKRAVRTRRLARLVAALALPLFALGLPGSLRATGATLVDGAATRSTFDALPTLWWASGTDLSGEHGDGLAGQGTDRPARVSWGPGVAIPRGTPVERVAAGDGSACAIAAGRAYCWGDNTFGQLGDGSTTASARPVAVATAPSGGSALPADAVVTDISVGPGAACAVADGDVYCWGDNSAGRLGDDSTAASSVPVAVATDGAGGSAMPSGVASAVVTGGGGAGSTTSFTCAIAAARAYCWGSMENGRLGNGVASASPWLVPFPVNTGAWGNTATVTSIGIGEATACAVADGRAYCWGRAVVGQLGNGSNAPGVHQTIPVAVQVAPASALPATALVTAVAVGATSACAVHDGRPYCWGTNRSGQLGADIATDTDPAATAVRRATAVAIEGVGDSELPADAAVTRITAGGRLSGASSWCVLAGPPSDTRRAYCWGDGSTGQSGLAGTADQRVPRPVATTPVSELPAAVDLRDIGAGEGVTILVAAP
jgi:alpha-tubulin suppressor-like RCC1 family protein